MFDGVLGFVMALAIVMISTKLCGMLARYFGLPQVLGYIVAGILIGPALFGMLGFSLIGFHDGNTASFIALDEFSIDGHDNFTVLDVFSKIGVIIIMFSAGLETNLDDLKKTGLLATLVAVAGVVVPMILGTLVSLPFLSSGVIGGFTDVIQGVFVGTILTATSVAITVSVLKELGKINTRIGTTLVSAAIIDDVIGMIVLSVVTSLGTSGATDAVGFDWFKAQWWGTIIMIIAFFAVAIASGIGLHFLFHWMDNKWPNTHRLPILGLATCFVYSFVAEEIFGVADITGAYLAGVVLSTVNRMAAYTGRKIEVNNYMIFGPVFFAAIGINMDFGGLSGWLILFAAAFVFVGLLGKIIGCGAVIKLNKGTWREAGITGVGMMARGEVALIVTNKGIEAGIIPSDLMIMTVLLILFSSILTPILLKKLFNGHVEPKELSEKTVSGADGDTEAYARKEVTDDASGAANATNMTAGNNTGFESNAENK